ncbi:alpha/beta-Hydrolases superfamily protein [Prunus dulcis]|uniref:Alpha/beta-Hydrolases superfamily protein n=1 Tax=Prunus dulcis TaxID=3755 RepID=A0A4Y1RS88_PRUDU|nr:alpha/beta-Hydrolases superfamily protein [Prunus dulcis]
MVRQQLGLNLPMGLPRLVGPSSCKAKPCALEGVLEPGAAFCLGWAKRWTCRKNSCRMEYNILNEKNSIPLINKNKRSTID